MFRAVPGGASFNSACAAARMGVRTAFLGALSTDALGQRLVAAAEGVDLTHAPRTEAPTPVSIATLKDGDAIYAIHHRGTAAGALTTDTLPALPAPRVLLLGGFSLIHEPAASAFETLGLRRGTETALYLDLNIRSGAIEDEVGYRRRLRRLIVSADIIKASDEDLAWWGDDLRRATPTALILTTHGAEGATAQIGQTRHSVPAPMVQVVDTVGAGDVFNAAWCAIGLSKTRLVPRTSEDIHHALRFAVTAASLSTQTPGASGPTLEEISCAL